MCRRAESLFLNGLVCICHCCPCVFIRCFSDIATGCTNALHGAKQMKQEMVGILYSKENICLKKIFTSCNYHSRADKYTGTHKAEEEICSLELSPWVRVISKAGFLPCTLGSLHIWETRCSTLTYKGLRGWKYDKQNPPQLADAPINSRANILIYFIFTIPPMFFFFLLM